jgi:two-component system sensor histidine kinase KdpD
VVEVADHGVGVPPDELERIFDKFFRSPRTSALSGTGLGLSIARGLVEAMGGSIHARNRTENGVGLVVRIILPVTS